MIYFYHYNHDKTIGIGGDGEHGREADNLAMKVDKLAQPQNHNMKSSSEKSVFSMLGNQLYLSNAKLQLTKHLFITD